MTIISYDCWRTEMVSNVCVKFGLRYADCYLFPAVGYPHTIRGGEGASDVNISYSNYQVGITCPSLVLAECAS